MISCWTIFKNCYHKNSPLFLWLQGIEKLHSVISNSVISGLSFLWNPWASTIWSWHLVTVFITLLYKLLCWQFKQRQIFQWVLFSITRISGTRNLFGLLDSSTGNRNKSSSYSWLHHQIFLSLFHLVALRILNLSCFWWTWNFFFLVWCFSESLWQVLVFFIWLARLHVLIYFSGQLHDLNFLKAIFLFLILSLSQTACSFSSVNIPQYNLKSSQQHFQFQVQKPSSAVVYMESSLSKQLLDWGSKNEPIHLVSTSQDPTVRQPSHFTQFQQSRREVKNKETPGVKYKKNEMLAKNAEITGTWTAASSFKSDTCKDNLP